MTSKGQAPSKMKIAIVGKEGEAYWYETVIEDQREGRVITKMLISGDPGDPKQIKRMIVKMGNEPAMEMSPQMMGQKAGRQDPKVKAVDKGTETVKVPAGSFTAKRFQYQDPEGVTDTYMGL